MWYSSQNVIKFLVKQGDVLFASLIYTGNRDIAYIIFFKQLYCIHFSATNKILIY